jgi:hypothetical protein
MHYRFPHQKSRIAVLKRSRFQRKPYCGPAEEIRRGLLDSRQRFGQSIR